MLSRASEAVAFELLHPGEAPWAAQLAGRHTVGDDAPRSIQSLAMTVAEAVVRAIDHYVRAELVTLALENTTPVALDRRRVELSTEASRLRPTTTRRWSSTSTRRPSS